MYDLIIIGGGPAGITAGIYASRKKLKTLLLTKDFVGQWGNISEVENYPAFEKISGMELVKRFLNHLKNFEIEIKEGEEVKKIKKNNEVFEIETKKDNKFQSRAVIVTSGRNPRPLGVPGEKDFIGRGISYCTICDAPFFKDKFAAVIGGGNAGFRAALDLIPYAKRIYILEASPKVRADEIYQERASQAGKVEIIFNTKVLEIKGKDKAPKSPLATGVPAEGLGIGSIVYQNLISQEKKELPIDGVFVEIGSIPVTSFLNTLVDFNEMGEVKIDSKTCTTKTPGLFAAGDVTDIEYKQIIIAASEGAKAALSAYNYLQTNEQN